MTKIITYPWPFKHMLAETDCPDGVKSFDIIAVNQETGEAAKVANVTSDPEKAKTLLQKCVLSAVSPTHLHDVVEDWLAD